MKFDNLISEIKNIKVGDEITLPSGGHESWIVNKEEEEYFDIENDETGEITKLSKYKLDGIKKVVMLEYKSQDEKDAEIKRYKSQIKDLKDKMKKFKANSKKGEQYKRLEKDLKRTSTALDIASRQTPRLTIY